MQAWTYTLIPLSSVVIGSLLAAWKPPGSLITSAVQHLAAGVVFAAGAAEIIPDFKRSGAMVPLVIGGTAGVILMLSLKHLEKKIKGPVGLVSAIGVDSLIDGLVLGLGFSSGTREGILLTIALTCEVFFSGLVMEEELADAMGSRVKSVLSTCAVFLLMPLGTFLAVPLAALPKAYATGTFALGLVALLYLVTEELLWMRTKFPTAHGSPPCSLRDSWG